jgi:hypothetical protein
MRRVTISIRPDLIAVLSDLAQRERRTPQQQAAWLVEQALLAVARTRPIPIVEEAESLLEVEA